MYRSTLLRNLRRWRLVSGTTCYFISDDGSVVSCAKSGFKLLKPWLTKERYLQVALRGARKHYIHRLVLSAFSDRSPWPGAVVDHLDFDRQNNQLHNLRWYDRVQNMRRTPGTAHLYP